MGRESFFSTEEIFPIKLSTAELQQTIVGAEICIGFLDVVRWNAFKILL